MNAEYLQDALNFLDDDLIEETDALRRGEAAIRRKSGIIRWIIPAAACLALTIGAASLLPPAMENSAPDSVFHDAAKDQEAGNQAPEFAGDTPGAPERDWQRLHLGGISLEIPEDWEYELVSGTEGAVYISVGTDGETALRVGIDPAFGVCGTGLEEKEITLAGTTARAGYYDGASRWSFIVFPDPESPGVIINEGSEAWWAVHETEARQVLDSIRFERGG